MAAGANVISLIVQATDQATAPLKRVQAQLEQTAQVAQQAGQQMGSALEASVQRQSRAVEESEQRFDRHSAALVDARIATMAFTSVLSHIGTLMRVTGVGSGELANQLQNVSLVLITATVAVQSFRGALAALPLILAAVRAALAALTGPVGWIIAGITLLVAGIVLLTRHFQAGKEAASGLSTSWRDVASSSQILAGGLATLGSAFADYGIHLKRAGEGLDAFRGTLQQLDFQDTVTGIDQWAARQEALGGTILKTSSRLGFLIGVKKEHLRRLQEEAQQTVMTRDQQTALTAKIESAKDSLISLNGELGKEVKALRDAALALADDSEAKAVLIDRTNALAAAERRRAQFLEEAAAAERAITEEINAEVRMIERDRAVAEAAAERRKQQFLDHHEQIQAIAEELSVDFARAEDLAAFAADRAAKAGISFAQALAQVKKEAKDATDAMAGFKPDFNLRLFQDFITASGDAADAFQRVFLQPIQSGTAAVVNSITMAFKEFFSEIGTGIGLAIGQMVTGLTGFNDFLNNLWNAIRQAFANLIAKMVADWLAGFLKMEAIKKAFSFLGGLFGGLFGFIGHLFGFQHGGIVTRPTLGLLGESGPEAVLPLSQMPGAIPGVHPPPEPGPGEPPVPGWTGIGPRPRPLPLPAPGPSPGTIPPVSLHFHGPLLLDDITLWKFGRMISAQVTRDLNRRTVSTAGGRPVGGSGRSTTSGAGGGGSRSNFALRMG